MNERMKRLRDFCAVGAIGTYDADDLYSDMRWLLHAYQELRGAVAMVATWTPTSDPDPWQDVSAKASAFVGMQNLANATLRQIDDFIP